MADERFEQDILPQPGNAGMDLARRPCIRYLQQTSTNLDKTIYFVAVRFTHWDRYPEVYKTAPGDMSIAMWRTAKVRDEYADRYIKEGHRVIVGDLTPSRLIEVLGVELSAVALQAGD